MDYVPLTSELEQATPQTAARVRRGLSVFHLLLLAVVSLAIFGSVFWFAVNYPDKMREILITVDRFGFTEVGAAEQTRVYTINRLPISFEEKQVLIKRTVFFGADLQMVSLALGKPVCLQKTLATADMPATEYWVYFIEGDTKPTQLAFQKGELVSASKSSALDICK